MLNANAITKVSKTISFSKPLTLIFEEESFTIITGPNRFELSTLLYLLSGLLKPDSGTVYFDDTNLYQVKATALNKLKQQKFSYLLQDIILLEELTVKENIELPAKLSKREIDIEYIETMLSLLALETVKENTITLLTKVEKIKILLIRAMSLKPEILCIDAITKHCDEVESKEVLEAIQLLHKNYAPTIILTTTNPHDVPYGQHIIQIENGEIVDHTTNTDVQITWL